MGFLGLFKGVPNVEEMQRNNDVNGLIKALKHKQTTIREKATKVLETLNDERAVQALREEKINQEFREEKIKRDNRECLICGGNVDATDASKLMTTSRDITAPSYNYGKICSACNGYVHYKCCKFDVTKERGITLKTGICPKCNQALLMFFPKT
jgi:hypothetical protein